MTKKLTGKPLKYKLIGAETSSDLNLFGLVVKYILYDGELLGVQGC